MEIEKNTEKISRETLTLCEVSARVVAHEPRLKVIVGKAGSGSYYDSEKLQFILDPKDCTSESRAVWISCHEGMHCWLTLPYSQIPLSINAKEDLYKQLGFSSTANIIEDCAGNDGMVRAYIGLTDATKEVYAEELAKEAGILGHPEVLRAFQKIGREPLFAKALKSILNSWAKFRVEKGDFSLQLDKYFTFEETDNKEVDELLKKASLAIKTAINCTIKDGKENKERVTHIALNRFNLTKDYVFPYIKKLVEQDLNEETLNEAVKKAKEEGALSEKVQAELENNKEQQEIGSNSTSNQEILKKSVDVSKLSEETKKEIEDYLNSLSPEEREELEERARKKVEELEDAIAEAFKPHNTEDDNPPTHKEIEEILNQENKTKEGKKVLGSLSMAIRDQVYRSATPYQRIYMDIAPRLEKAEESIRHVFQPEENEEWRGAFPTGQKLNIKSALQYEADKTRYNRLFDRRDVPTAYSYEFDLLIDRSGSMEKSGKLDQTKRGAVFLIELLSRFDIPCCVRVFDNTVKTVKKWEDEASDPNVQKTIAESLVPQGRTDDALAIGKAYVEGQDRQEKHKFIIVFSDAESGASKDLRLILKKIQSDQVITLFHFGIGPGTADEHGFYANSRGDLPITGEGNFFDVFVSVVEEMILEPYKFKGVKL